MNFIKWILIIVLLGGCQPRSYTHEYLLAHPDQMGKEIANCENKKSWDTDYCQMIQRAEREFVALAEVRASNPEQFGMQIMASQKKLTELTEEHAIKQQQQKIMILLAVIRATSRSLN